jgi:hypothetical protein
MGWALGCAATSVFGFVAVRATGAQPALEPGMWKISVTSTTNGKSNPKEDTDQCLGEELKDLASYFAPQLEGAQADCTKTLQPSKDPNQVAYRMQCRGAGFTVDALTSVTFEDSRHFTMTMRIDSRAPQESAVVVANGDGQRTGTCPAP